MADAVNAPRGMRDFLPGDKAERERILSIIRSTYRAHGFDEIETPALEESDRLHAGLGGDNEKLSYGVLKRGLEAADLAAATTTLDLVDLGLRYDLTVPLARFYASHRSELPPVFRAVQIGSVWRAERPQKGRYRQFVQCDIDIIGEAGLLAEVELLTATAAVLDALALGDWTFRVNDRGLLTSVLQVLEFPAKEHDAVLITLDKLDKIGPDGVLAELASRGFPTGPIAALKEFFTRPTTLEFLPFGEKAIRKALPEGIDDLAIARLVELGLAVGDADRERLVFDPFLVRGMGYYTGVIVEIAHSQLGYSLGGGGRYDGMIGRFLGTSVPAVGLSLGFERLVELVEKSTGLSGEATVLLHDDGIDVAQLVGLKNALATTDSRVRLERKPKNLAPTLERLAREGFSRFALVTPQTRQVDQLEFRPLATG
jgi:histidyl-tRNA synthetase